MNLIKQNLILLIVMVVVFLSTTAPVVLAQNLTADVEKLPYGDYLSARHALYNNRYADASDYYLKALKLDPDNEDLNKTTLGVLITDGRFDDALRISHYLKNNDLETDISKLLIYFEMAKNGQFEDIVEATDELAKSGILAITKPFYKAWALAELGRFDQVETIIATFGEGTSFNFFNYYHSALLYEFMNDREQAGLYFAKALDAPGILNLRAVEAYGQNLRFQNKKNEAIAHYQKYLKKVPNNQKLQKALFQTERDVKPSEFISGLDQGYAEIFYEISLVLMQDNIKNVATNFLQYALFFKQDFALCNFLLAQIFQSDKYYSGAVLQLEKISRKSPLYFQAKLQRALLFNDLGEEDRALNELKVIEQEYPDNRVILNAIAEFYRMHERYGDAKITYDKIIKNIKQEKQSDWLIYYTRAIVLDQEKHWSAAEKDFKKALILSPEQPMVLNYLAYSWVDRGKNYIEAKKMLERAVELRPNNGYIVDSLGWALFKMGDNKEAVGILERAAQLQTQDWAINDHLGDAYWIVGRKNEARFQWRHALSLKPDEDKIDSIKSKIKNGYEKPEF